MKMASEPVYANVDELKAAPDFKNTQRSERQLLRRLETASRIVEGMTHRKFYPLTATRYKDWPNRDYTPSHRLYLNEDELISVTELLAGTTEIEANDYILEPDSGPPFRFIDLKRDTSASFGGATTSQRAITITGVFGYRNDELTAGAIVTAINASVTTLDISRSDKTGIGAILHVNNERLIVTDTQALDTGDTLQSNIAENKAVVAVPVSDGTSFNKGEVITLDSEKMLIVDITGNSLQVQRAWDGTPLAAHTATATVYANRRLTVERGALGTTAASHAQDDTVFVHQAPSLIKTVTLGLAIVGVTDEQGAYTRRAAAQAVEGWSLGILIEQMKTTYARKSRLRGI